MEKKLKKRDLEDFWDRILQSCPKCGSQEFRIIGELPDAIIFECLKCLHWFEEKKKF